MYKAEIIEGIPLIANDQSPEISQPGEEPFNFPATPVAPKWAAILGPGTGSTAPMGRNHLDPQLDERRIERIGIITAVPDQSARELVDKSRVKGGRNEGNFARRSRGGTRGER
jgi:hypothetical protein